MTDGFENGFNPTCDASCKTTVWTQEYYNAAKGTWVSEAPQFSQSWKTEMEKALTDTLRYPIHAAKGKGRAYFRNEPDKNGNVQTAGYKTRLITPVMDLSKGYQPILRFYHAQAKYTGDFDTLRVYYRTGEGLSWNLISEYTSPIKNWKFEEIGLPAVGEYYQIAFEASENIGRGIVLDSVLVRTRPQITTPHDITFLDMRDNGVTVQWQASMDADYFQVAMFQNPDIDLNVSPDLIHSSSIVVDTLLDSEGDQKLRVEGLKPGATYYVQVRSIGEIENSVWCDVRSIRMNVSVQVPYYDSFDSLTTVGSTSAKDCRDTKWVWGGDNQPFIPMFLSGDVLGLLSPSKSYAVAFVKWGTYNSTTGFTDAKTFLPAGETSLLVSPEIASKDKNFNVNQCHVTFWGTVAQATDAHARSIIIGVMTDPEDITTFVAVDTCTVWGYKTFQFFDVDLASYKGDGRYIGFLSNFNKTNQFYIDDFTIEERPAVGRVQMASIRVLPDTTAAMLTWDAVQGATKYTVQVAKLANKGIATPIYAKDMGSSFTFTTATPSITLSDLIPASKYVVAVQAEGGEWSQPRAFFTSAEMTVSDVVEAAFSFEEDEGDYNMEDDQKTLYPTDFMIFSNAPDYPYIFTDNFRTGARCLGMTKNVGCDTWVVAPMADNLSELEVQFYSKTSASGQGSLQVGVMTYPDDISTFVMVEEFSQESVYKKRYANFLSYKGTGKYIAFRWTEVDGATKSCNYIDDIIIRKLGSCLPITGLTIVPTDSSAVVSWNRASASKWQLKVNSTPLSDIEVLKQDGNVFPVTEVTENTYTLKDSLTWAHTYYVYVRAVCGEDSYGDWVGKAFTTDCPAQLPIPFKDDFERYDATTTKIPYCWGAAYTGTSQSYPKVYNNTTHSHSGSQCIDLYSTASYGSYLVLPELSIPLSDAHLRFYAKGSANTVLFVGVMTNPDDGDTFTRIDSIPMTTSNEQYSVQFRKYAGQGKHIAFSSWRGSTNQVYLDDVEIVNVIDGAPFNFDVKETTSSSMTAQWEGVTTDGWNVIVSKEYYPLVNEKSLKKLNPDTITAARVASGTVKMNEFTIEDGLEPMTYYYFYVKSTKGTEWAVGTLMTACKGVNPREKKTEGFEIGKTVTSTLASNVDYSNDYRKAQVPLCWTVGNAKYGTDLSKATTGTIRNYFPFIISNGSIPTSGTSAGNENNYYDKGTANTTNAYAADGYNCLKLYGSYNKTASNNYAPAWVAMPRLECEDEDLPMIIITGQVQMSTSNSFIVGVMDDPEDMSTFVDIDSIKGGKGTGKDKAIAFEVSLENYTGKGHYIAFRTPYGKTSTAYLDEINISMAECAAPNISFTQVTDTTARIMSGLRIDNAWKYYYGFTPFDVKKMDNGEMPVREFADTIINAPGDTILKPAKIEFIDSLTVGDGSVFVPYAPLRGLLPDTTYYVAATTVCDGTTSTWRTASFTTLCSDEDITTFKEDFEGYSSEDIGCWTVGNILSTASSGYIPSVAATTFPNYPKTKMLLLKASKTYGNGAYAVMSGVSFPNGKSIKDYQIEMTAVMSGYSGKLQYGAQEEGSLIVGITTNPRDLAAMQVIDTIRFTTPTITKLVIPFDAYKGDGKFVVLYAEAFDKTTSWLYVDDIKLSPIPSCKHAHALQIDTIEQTLVKLHWEGSSPMYNVALSSVLYADSVKSDSLIAANSRVILQQVTADSVTITGLKPNSNYYVYVQGVCGETDKSVWSYESPIFRTECPVAAAIPWFDDFDDVMYLTGSGNFGYCYEGEYINNGAKQSAYPQINSRLAYASSGMQSMKVYGTTMATTALATPELDVNSITELQLSFYAMGTAGKWLYIGTIDSVDAMVNTFVPFDSVLVTAGMEKYSINLDTVQLGERAGKKHIAFLANGNSGTVYIDDLYIRYIPTCYEPTDVTVSGIEYEKAALSFVPFSESDNKWVVRLNNITDEVSETITLTQPLYQFTNLKPNTHYSVKVRTDCGTELSEWTKDVAFHTKWIIDSTYTFTFKKNEQGTISDNTPLSYTAFIHPALTSVSGINNTSAYYPQYTANSTTYAYALDPTGNTDANALKFQTSAKYDTSAVILPIIRNPKDKQISFYVRAAYAYVSDYTTTPANQRVVNTVYPKAVLTVGTVDSAGTIESFRAFTDIKPSKLVAKDTLRKTSNYGWDKVVIPLSSLPMEGRQVAFMMDGGKTATLYMGQLAIEKAEGFTTPTITDVMPTDTTVTIKWSGSPTAVYNIFVIDTIKAKPALNYFPCLQDAKPEMVTVIKGVVGTSYTIKGLKETTTYAIYVQDTVHAVNPASLSNRVITTTVCSTVSGNGYSYSFEVGPGYIAGKTPKDSYADGFTFQWPESAAAGDTVYRTPDCWTVGIDKDGYDPTSTTYKNYNPTMIPNSKTVRYSLTGNGALQLYGNSSYNEVYAVLPPLSLDMDTAELVFYGRCFNEKIQKDLTGTVSSISYLKGGSSTAWSQKVAVGTVLDPGDISTYVPLDTIEYGYTAEDLNTSVVVDYDPANLRYFQKFTVPLRGAKGQFIVLKQVGFGYMWIDDISIQKHQTPRAPRDLSAKTDVNSATVTWRPMEQGGTYTIQYMEKTTTKNWTKATTVTGLTETTYTIPDLKDATDYVWRVRQDNSDFGTSDYAAYASFMTDCKLYTPNGFKTSFEGTADDPDYMFYRSGSSTYMQNLCWSYINQGSSTSKGSSWAYNIPATSIASYAHSGKVALKLTHDKNNQYRTVAVTPLFDAEVGESGKGFDTLQVSFWICPSPHGLSGTNKNKISTASTKLVAKKVEVGTCTDPNDPGTYTVLDSCIYVCEGNALTTGTQADATNDYAFQKFIVKLDKATGPYVFFRANKNHTLEDGTVCTSSTMYIDDVQFETLQRCEKPFNVVLSDVTIHSAQLTWDSYEDQTFDVMVSTDAAFTDTVFIKDSLVENRVKIEGLKHATRYFYHIRSYCDTARTEASDWTQTANFLTPFAPVFDETFTVNDLTNTDKGWKFMKGYAKDIFAGGQLEPNTSSSDYNSWYRIENNVLNGMHLRMTMFYGGSANVPATTYQTETYYQKYWLITPLITIEKDSIQLIFDASLSTYEFSKSTLNQPIRVNESWNTGWDDQFMIIVSEDGGETWKRENAIIWNNETTNDTTDKHYRYGIGDYRLTDIAYNPHKMSIDLSKYAGKTVKIAFYCENTEQNANCAIHIDNVHVNYVVKQSKDMSSCQFVDIDNLLGFSIDGDSVSAGLHNLERYVLATQTGNKDSIFTLNIDVREAPIYNYDITVCEGTPFEYLGFNEHTYPGTYRMKLTSKVTGCDSIVNFTIHHTPKFKTTIDTTICEGSFINFDGKPISEAGTYVANLKASEALGGCDSIVTLRLSVTALKRSLRTVAICEGESYQFGGKEYAVSGVYHDTIATSACDSIATLSLTVRTNVHTIFTDSILHGESYTWAGKVLTEAATVDSTFTDVNGCDSIVTLNLLVKYADVDYQYEYICQGGTYEFGGKIYDAMGTYYDTIQVAGQADVVKGLVLTVRALETNNITDFACAGETYTFGDTVLTSSGTYSHTYSNRYGCDSIVNLTLTVLETSKRQIAEQICKGSFYDFFGRQLSESGTYYDTAHYVSGCDSIITTLQLTVAEPTYGELSVAICQGGDYIFGDTTLTTVGDYERTIANHIGCDSIITLHLSINEPLRGTKYASFTTGCSYTYNGVTYDKPGEYQIGVFKTEAGCDSIITLVLSEAEQGRDTVWAEVCPGQYYIDADFDTNVAGTHEVEVMQSSGCSIIRTLILTNTDNSVAMQAAICQGDSYEFYGQTLTEAGSYTETLKGQGEECDTVVTLTLSVLSGDTLHVTDEITTDQLPYMYNGEVILPLDTKEGVYTDTVEVKSETGKCSQTVILTVTVRQADAVDNIGYNSLQIRPNAISRGETVYIEHDFSASERAEMNVEMFDMLGHRMDVRVPETGAITISNFPSAGIYTVRISTGEQTYIGRIVVKN